MIRKDVKAPYLEIKKRADGYNLPMKVNVPLEIVGNKITLPNYFSYPYNDRFRDYRVDYELIIPKNMKVISLNDERGFSVDDDDYNDDNDQMNTTTVNQNEDSVTLNSGSNSIVVPSDNGDSIIINGKKVGKKEAELMIKKMRFNSDDVENVDISIKNGKKEISIKTK